jgi:outer membrane protein assembly factor BamB
MKIKRFLLGVFIISFSGSLLPQKQEIKKLWEVKLKSTVVSSPIFAHDKVFLPCSDNKVYAFDVDKGKEVMELDVREKIAYILSDSKNLYVVTRAGKLLSYDLKKKEKLWELRISKFSNSIAMSDQKVYASDNKKFFSIDKDEGKILWKVRYTLMGRSMPVVYNGKVYISSQERLDDRFTCLDAKRGRVKWVIRVRHPDSTPVVDKKYIYLVQGVMFGGPKMVLTKIRRKNGKILRERTLLRRFGEYDCVGVDEKNIYILGRGSGRLFCCRKKDLKVRWKLQDIFGIALASGKVYAVSKEMLYCLRAEDGKQIWKFKIEGEGKSPILVKGKIYVACGKKLYCIDAKDPKVDGWYMEGGGAERGGYNRKEAQ